MFEGPKSKIKRANHHIQNLESILRAFWKTNFYRLRVDEESQPGSNILVMESLKKLPDDFPMILGDGIHNLRSALDIMACDLVAFGGNKFSKHAKFIFAESRDQLEARFNGGILKSLLPEIVALIIDTIKPYKGGNDALVALHDLDIQDKHFLISSVMSMTAVSGVWAKSPDGAIIENCTFGVRQSGNFNMIRTTPGLKITKYGKPAFEVFFGEGALEGQPIFPTLHQLAQLVSGIVDAIEQECLART